MQTLEQKAEELIEKFLPYVDSTNVLSDEFDKNWRLRNAINCAIICVDEILKSSPSLPILSDAGNLVNDIEESTEYWQEVKQILENKL